MTSRWPIFLKATSRGPIPTMPGIRLRGPRENSFREPQGILLQGTLVAEVPDCHPAHYEPWLRSLFVVAIRRSSQAACVGNILKDRIVFEGDMQPAKLKDGRAVAATDFEFMLDEALGATLPRDDLYVQLSARQYRSNVVLLSYKGPS